MENSSSRAGSSQIGLEEIADLDDFAARAAQLADSWPCAGLGVEMVEPILRFLEEHPAIEFGTPGPLVHYVESFFGQGYEEKLIESVERRPVAATVWMLNRVINGTRKSDVQSRFIATMKRHPVKSSRGSNREGLGESIRRTTLALNIGVRHPNTASNDPPLLVCNGCAFSGRGRIRRSARRAGVRRTPRRGRRRRQKGWRGFQGIAQFPKRESTPQYCRSVRTVRR